MGRWKVWLIRLPLIFFTIRNRGVIRIGLITLRLTWRMIIGISLVVRWFTMCLLRFGRWWCVGRLSLMV